MSNNVCAEMPRYKCHKEVRALKIKRIDLSGFVIPEDARYAEIPVGREYIAKHKPEAGGYLVVYDDNYKSYSPAKAFESGYTRI